MKFYKHKISFISSIVIAALLLPFNISASTLEEVVVTAQRRTENIQSISLAVSAFDEEAMRRYGLNDFRSLQALTPGFNYSSAGADARPTLRGSTVNLIEANADPSIGFFVDGIFASRTSQATIPFVDIQRVEVLRGPQGTLFGRNTSAGSLNIIPNKPSTEGVQYGGEAGIADYDAVHFKGYANVPLGDTAAIRIAASRDIRDDGYIRNIGTGSDYADKDESFYRVGLSFEPTDRMSINLMGQYFDKDDSGSSTLGYIVTGSLYDTTTAAVTRSLFGTALPFNPRVRDGVADVNGVDIGVPVSSDPFEVDFDFNSQTDIESKLFRGEFNYQLTDWADFKLIGSYWDHDAFRSSENDFTSIPTAAQAVFFTTQGETTQIEAQLSSSQDGALDWVLGLFYYDDSQFEFFTINALPGSTLLGLNIFPNGLVFNRTTTVDTKSFAGFGQVGWNFSDNLRLILGGRYTVDDKDYSIANPSGVGGGTFADSDSFKRFTWKAAVEYSYSEDNLLYASVSTGFRSGGFNRQPTQAPFDSEKALSFEIGSKNEFFDNRLRLNIAAYYVEYDDLQATAVAVDPVSGQSLGSFFQNAGKGESYGLEIEFQAVPVEPMLLAGAIAFQHAEFEEFLQASNPFPLPAATPVVDISGNDRQNSPAITATFAASYDIALGEYGSLRPQVIVEISDDYFTTQYNTPIDHQDGFVRADASLTYIPNENWQVEAYVTNLSDEVIQDYGTFGGSNAAFSSYQAPRMFGVKVRADF